jgi:hypothetical protein
VLQETCGTDNYIRKVAHFSALFDITYCIGRKMTICLNNCYFLCALRNLQLLQWHDDDRPLHYPHVHQGTFQTVTRLHNMIGLSCFFKCQLTSFSSQSAYPSLPASPSLPTSTSPANTFGITVEFMGCVAKYSLFSSTPYG